MPKKTVQRRVPVRTPAALKLPPQPAVGDAEEDSAPLIDLTDGAFEPEDVEQVHLFTIGGVKYMAPTQVSASIAVEMLRRSSEDGAEATMWWVFNEVLGADAVEALSSYDGLTMVHLGKIFTACEEIITGSSPDPKSRRRGSGLPR